MAGDSNGRGVLHPKGSTSYQHIVQAERDRQSERGRERARQSERGRERQRARVREGGRERTRGRATEIETDREEGGGGGW